MLELLLVIALVSIISLIGYFFSISEFKTDKIEVAGKDLRSSIYRYQQYAFTGKNGKSYGFMFEESQYSMFIGPDYANAESIEVVTLPNNISIVNINFDDTDNEIVFNTGSYSANTFGTLELTDGDFSYNLEITSEGWVSLLKL